MNEDQKLFDFSLKDAIMFYYKYTKSVEVLRDNNLEKDYFYVLPYCTRITETMKSEFLASVNVESSKTKVTDLIVESQNMIIRLQYEEK